MENLTSPPADGTLGPCPGKIATSGTHYQLDGPADGKLTVLITGIGDFSFKWENLAALLDLPS